MTYKKGDILVDEDGMFLYRVREEAGSRVELEAIGDNGWCYFGNVSIGSLSNFKVYREVKE